MGRWRVGVLILAVVALGLSSLWPRSWLPESFRLQAGRTALFWLGVVCFLAAAWGRAGT